MGTEKRRRQGGMGRQRPLWGMKRCSFMVIQIHSMQREKNLRRIALVMGRIVDVRVKGWMLGVKEKEQFRMSP